MLPPVDATAEEHPLRIPRGGASTIPVEVLTAAGQPHPLTGITLHLQVTRAGSTTLLLDQAVEVLDEAAGLGRVVITQEDSSGLPEELLRWRLVDTTAGAEWVVGDCEPQTRGRAGAGSTGAITAAVSTAGVLVRVTAVAGAAGTGGTGLPDDLEAGQVPVIGADGETVEGLSPNTPDGWLRLGPDGLVPDIHLRTNVVRTSELDSAVAGVRDHFGMVLAVDVSAFGAVYDAEGDTLTMAMLVGFGVPTGALIAVTGQPTTALNAVWQHQGAGLLARHSTSPFVAANFGRRITTSSVIDPDGQATSPATLVVAGDGSFVIDTSGEQPIDPSDRWGLAALEREWAESTDLVLRTHPTPESMDGSYDATWTITNPANASGTLPHTPTGIDVRIHERILLRYQDHQLGPLQRGTFQKYREELTQTKPGATGGDQTEVATMEGDGSDPAPGKAVSFSEHTPQGAPGEVGHPDTGILVCDMGPLIGVPVIKRYTHDTANLTITHWRWVPYDTGEPGIAVTVDEDDGRVDHWFPVASWTFPDAATMDDYGLGDDPLNPYPDGLPDPWRIGIQNRAEFRRITKHHFGGAKILDIRPEHINAAGVGATSFVDGVGTTIATVTGDIFDPHAGTTAAPTAVAYGQGDGPLVDTTTPGELTSGPITVPAGPGDKLDFTAWVDYLNDSGAARTHVASLRVGGAELVRLPAPSLSAAGTARVGILNGTIRVADDGASVTATMMGQYPSGQPPVAAGTLAVADLEDGLAITLTGEVVAGGNQSIRLRHLAIDHTPAAG